MKTFKKILLNVIAISQILGFAAKAADVTVELMSGDKIGVIDTKISGQVAPKLNYFCRNRISFDYENKGKAGYFTFIDLTTPIAKGLDFVGEFQFPQNETPDPRIGFQYFKSLPKNSSAYGLATRGFKENPYTEIVFVGNFSPKLKENLNLYTRLESLFDLPDKGNVFQSQRIRLGLMKNGIAFGAAADISGKINEGETKTNIGAFILKRF